ncbi:MAG: Adenosylmethionine-8-amino-7-oxononanoate aminotransferase [Alphaproteobacteria bacterium MarineAlpha11_Bin1]|nr:MAG: Adenosylmethionine-8-amino-7-oxononanoate aminotransferase [Alphaproteobacteria bacterium MarineAlpha11_Bin1]
MTTPIPHLWLPYSQMQTVAAPLRAARTVGTRIILDDGRELIDAVSSWWTACHGYNHPHIVMAMEKQLKNMPHVMFGGLVHEPAERLAARLTSILPGPLNRVFFADSGSVAVEVAMKIAVQYNLNCSASGRTRFLSFRDGYHGDTMAAMSVTDPDEGMHSLFKGYLPEQIIAPIPRDENSTAEFRRLLDIHRDEIAAVIVEPLVQCAGGMKIHKPEVLKFIADSTHDAGALLICDEIAVNFCRVGTMFAHTQANIAPDIICLGKALTGGAINLAATVATADVFEAFLSENAEAALMHGPTYMATPLACAAANASLDLFETEQYLSRISAIETQLMRELAPLEDLPNVTDVRVKGAIGAIEVKNMYDLDWLKTQFVETGIWLRPFGKVIYTMPPFSITASELSLISGAMVEILPRWAQRFHG